MQKESGSPITGDSSSVHENSTKNKLNPNGRYLIQEGSGHIYIWSEALAKRKDMRPYDPVTGQALVPGSVAPGQYEGDKEVENDNPNALPPLPPGWTVQEPTSPDGEQLRKFCHEARLNGFLILDQLISILASDEIYQDYLPKLWERFRVDIRKEFPDDITSPLKRRGVWYALLERWTNGTVSAVVAGLNPIRSLPGGYLNQKGEVVRIDKGFADNKNYFMLNDLADYFTGYLEIPLPALLFPPAATPAPPDSPVDMAREKEEFSETGVSGTNFLTRNNGDYWHIGFAGQDARLKKSVGLQYIAFLLEKPKQSISCIDLCHAMNPAAAAPISNHQAMAEGLNLVTGAKGTREINDDSARKAYLQKYHELQENLKNVESGIERKETEEEMDAILREIKARNFPDIACTRAQSSVIKALKRAYSAMEKNKMAEFSKFLQSHIKPDKRYGYIYDGPPWEVSG